MEYIIQGHTLSLNTILLDLNGTLTVHGRLPCGVRRRLRKLERAGFSILLVSGDQRGTAARFAKRLHLKLIIARTSDEKEKIAKKYKNAVAIGNARIDLGLFKHAKCSIATLQAEGIHADIISAVDIIVPSVKDALDLLLIPDGLIGTMKE